MPIMSNTPYEKRPLGWKDLVPADWIDEPGSMTIWVTGFLAMGLNQNSFLDGPKAFDLGDIRVIILFGQLIYDALSMIEIRSSQTPQFHIRTEERVSPEGGHLLVLQPFDPADEKLNETVVRKQVKAVAGLIASTFGQNLVFHRLFDNSINLRDNKKTVYGQSFRHPGTLPVPDVSDKRLRLTSRGYEALSQLTDSERNRAGLSLQWYYDALNASGVDKFLKCWLAIETLGMPDTPNIRPLNERLARAYSVSHREAKERFSVGRLLGFRSEIVHEGKLVPIHSLLSDYVEGLYIDILFEQLGLECERAAEGVLNKPNFDLEKLTYR